MELDKKNVRKICTIIFFSIVVFLGLQNINPIVKSLGTFFSLFTPFMIGAAIAFILNVPLNFIERNIFDRIKPKSGKGGKILSKIKRPISVLLSLCFVLFIIFIVFFLIIPQLGDTIGMVKESIPPAIDAVQRWLLNLTRQYPDIYSKVNEFIFDWEKISSTVLGFLQTSATSVLNSTVNFAAALINGIINFFLALVFAFYVLMQKEKLIVQSKKFMYSFIKERYVDNTVNILSLSNRTFSRFLSGQCTEAVILGIMFFIAMSILRFPYALMISVLIAFTALIPMFGGFIGCGIGAFLIVMVDPMKALWFIVMFFILQQIEGNFIYPHVVGSSVGLPSIWVLVAVTLGGSLMGIVGMLLFIPMFSVIYAILKETVGRRLQERKIEKEKLRLQ